MNREDDKKIICRLFNERNGTTELYKGPVYTKLDGLYGYLCVENFKVLFFWHDENDIYCDELDYFKVLYERS